MCVLKVESDYNGKSLRKCSVNESQVICRLIGGVQTLVLSVPRQTARANGMFGFFFPSFLLLPQYCLGSIFPHVTK